MPTYFQPRDLNALSDIGDIPWLSSLEIRSEHYPTYSLRSYQRRIAQFCKDQILEPFDVTITVTKKTTKDRNKVIPRKKPRLFRLTVKGAGIVEHLAGYRVKRPARSRISSPQFMLHRSGVARFAWYSRKACRATGIPDPEIIFEQDVYPNAKNTDPAERKFVAWETFAYDGGTVSVRPDVILHFALPGVSSNLCAYGEYDRSTESPDMFAEKVLPYAILLDPQHHHYRRHFSQADFARVLVVCHSRDRIDNLRQAIKDRPGCQNFRFVLESDLKRWHLADRIWIDVDGNCKGMMITPV